MCVYILQLLWVMIIYIFTLTFPFIVLVCCMYVCVIYPCIPCSMCPNKIAKVYSNCQLRCPTNMVSSITTLMTHSVIYPLQKSANEPFQVKVLFILFFITVVRYFFLMLCYEFCEFWRGISDGRIRTKACVSGTMIDEMFCVIPHSHFFLK